MREIKLTQGKVALVDDEDYERLCHYKWTAIHSHKSWYAVRGVGHGRGRPVRAMHWFMLGGQRPGLEVDHIDGNGLNNQRANLRMTTRSVNARNQWQHRAGKLAGTFLLRDCRRTKPWVARITWKGKSQTLGWFKTAEEAHERFLRAVFVRELIVWHSRTVKGVIV